MRFNKLPVEIQYAVFSNFSAQDLCTIVAPVCRRWRKFSYQPSNMWKIVKLCGRTQTSFQISNILKRCFRVHRLELHYIDDFSWLTHLPRSEFLREIYIDSCVITSEIMSQFLQLFPYVQIFDFESSLQQSNNSDIKQIVRWSHLTKIRLMYTSGNYLRVITEECANLTSLEICIRNETQDSFERFLKLRGHQLRYLSLPFLLHLDSAVYQSLLQCHHLTCLNLHFAMNFTDVNFIGLISGLKQLKHVTISNSIRLFTKESFSLYESAHYPSSMESFQLIWCSIIDGETLRLFLKCCPFRSLTFKPAPALYDLTQQQFLSIATECKKFKIREEGTTSFLTTEV